ncbi:MAG: hypothetical protein V2I41_12510 [Pseudomonadales bacterium]|jgi:hypothetical protein|nr:hypothetical protein [Pseudomonadales bacterium]
MSRYSAFALHLGISFLIFVVLTYLVVFEWYPGIFFDSDGGWRGMRIIIAVDLVLGPLLTLIVFKAGKPGLKFDMTAIALLQFVCLSAGTYVVYSERPLAVVFSDGRFSVMNKKDYIDAGQERAPNLKNFPGDNPKWVMVALPDSVEDEADLRRNMFQSGQLVSTASDLYVPFTTSGDNFFSEAEEIEVVLAGKGWQARVDNWLADQDRKLEDYAFFTYSTRFVIGYLIYDRATRERVGIITNET